MTKQQNKSAHEASEFFKDITQASHRVFQTYLDNLPNLIHSGKDLAEAWRIFGTSITSHHDNSSFAIGQAYFNFYKKQMELWQEIHQHIQQGGTLPLSSNGDKRFKSPEWSEAPYYFYFIKQTYLLASELFTTIIEQADIDEQTRKKLKFYIGLFIEAMSPANFIVTNPEVIKLAQQTGGESLRKGFLNFIHDMKQGRISQTDFSAFEVGKNLAITPGSVIFQNELIQIIQYKPLTKNVFQVPLLIIPPWINRYYILDLEPHNSFVRFAVQQGFTVFMISWRVPKGEMGNITFDDYAQSGVLDAIAAIQEITKQKKVNALGYCIGGTLLGTVGAILSARKTMANGKKKTSTINPLNTLTFLASMLDFSDFGQLSAVVDFPLVEKMEKEIGQNGILKGRDMTNAFNMIRSKDLIWNYVVNNYLKGNSPAPYSILYWTNDNTNLPGKMYTYYLRHFILKNKLSKKDALKICGTPIDLGRIKNPCYVVGTAEDHISPCRTAFATTHLVGGKVEFILGESGHVAGIINPPPPHNGKYGYYHNGKLGKDLQHFRNTAQHCKESWWLHWAKWLRKYSGKQITAPSKPGSKKYKVIEPAPGSYVKEKM